MTGSAPWYGETLGGWLSPLPLSLFLSLSVSLLLSLSPFFHTPPHFKAPENLSESAQLLLRLAIGSLLQRKIQQDWGGVGLGGDSGPSCFISPHRAPSRPGSEGQRRRLDEVRSQTPLQQIRTAGGAGRPCTLSQDGHPLIPPFALMALRPTHPPIVSLSELP